MAGLTERYETKIHGTLSCFDRVIISGMIPQIGYAGAMNAELYRRKVRVFDYEDFVAPFRDEIRENAERLAAEHGLEIEFIRKRNFRKEKKIKEILAQRGDHPGLVHIFSAMEKCPAYRPWFDKKTNRAFVRYRDAKCLHYYFYFIDETYGLCFLRVPTWAPFRLQFYFNGHQLLASRLRAEGIGFTLADNLFLAIEDFPAAQKLADDWKVGPLHRRLDQVARLCCPVIRHFSSGYHWSVMQAEFATDILFTSRAALQPLYEVLSRTAIHAVKPRDIVTFLGRRWSENLEAEIGSQFSTRIEGTRIRHRLDDVSVKMYDKHGIALRIETTTNNVSFFKHRRKVEHRDGSSSMKVAPVKKTIYSLPVLRDLMGASNHRYLEFLSALDDPSSGIRNLTKISRRVRDRSHRSHRGFNLFDGPDLRLFEVIISGEFAISGFQNRHLRDLIPEKSSSQIGRMLKRLRTHGLIRKVRNSYRYRLTKLGQQVATAALIVRRLAVIPALATS